VAVAEMGWRMVRWELELGFLDVGGLDGDREKRYGRRNGQLNVGPRMGEMQLSLYLSGDGVFFWWPQKKR
jgi:hypothetical protein